MNNNPENLLHPLILKWLNRQGWTSLHDIQKQSIEPILEGKNDIIISASTASGKTEAAFLPACTKATTMKTTGVNIIYISPLKALINDQYKRIEDIGKAINLNVTPWHGDISSHKKQQLYNIPNGILLITPESLESLLINHLEWCKNNFANLNYFIIDEFHAFIGNERGYQVLSILHRIEFMIKKFVPRIALSATLSNIDTVKQWLRPIEQNTSTKIIQSNTSNKKIKIQIRGYEVDSYNKRNNNLIDYNNIATDIFKLMRGQSNLVFTNSRAKTEFIANALTKLTEINNLPLEFYPHHSSLSKEHRERLEDRLKDGRNPTTAICTQTLELGIDIGEINSVAQIDPPQSVASLRQRLGRAGRRHNSDATLRLFIPSVVDKNQTPLLLSERLHEEIFLTSAMIELVLERWFEPPIKTEYALSTLTHQILCVIAQYGSAYALDIWKLLCDKGPFKLINQSIFSKVLKSLGENDLITQMSDKTLTLGLSGEKLASNYNFYTCFKVQEEYTIDNNGHIIGRVPLLQPLSIGDNFIFAGKAWELIFINSEKHQLFVKPYNKDSNPISLDGSAGHIHDEIRKKMYELYTSDKIPLYLDKKAKEHLLKGRECFEQLKLDQNCILDLAEGVYLFPWKGDRILNTIQQIFKKNGINTKTNGSYVLLPKISKAKFLTYLSEILKEKSITEEELAASVGNIECDKYDNFLSTDLLRLNYGYRNFDIVGAYEFLIKVNNNI